MPAPSASDEADSSSVAVSRFLAVCAAVALVAMLTAFLRAWTLAFNSDFAIVGLLAKRFLETGELPLFIGQVGYQGLLVEVPAVAAAYKLFGIHRYSLNVAPALFTVGLVYLFYGMLRQSCGRLVGVLASLCLAVSSSYWYHEVARTQPNYVETFAFGLMLFQLYWSFLKARSVDLTLRRRDYRTIAAFGFVLGFALYTYGQILYFAVAIGLHASLLYLRGIYRREASPVWWKHALRPRGGLAEAAATALAVLLALAWLAMAMTGRYEFRGRPQLLTSPFANFVLLLVAYGLLHGISFVCHYGPTLLANAKALATLFAALVLGYSPKLYYNFVLKLPSVKRTGISGYWHDAVRRLGIAWQGNLDSLNLHPQEVESVVLGVTLALCFVAFLVHAAKLAWSIVTAQRDWTVILDLPLVALLPIPILGLFALSDGVVDAMSARYTISLWLFYAAAVAWCAVRLWMGDRPDVTQKPRLSQTNISRHEIAQRLRKIAAVVLVVTFLTNNAIGFIRTVREAPDTTGFEPVIEYLQANNLSRGYGYFWYAYAITLQTNEDIIIDSLDPRYLPFYEARIAEANEIAYLDKAPYRLDATIGQTVSIEKRNYRVLDKKQFNEMSVYRLRRD